MLTYLSTKMLHMTLLKEDLLYEIQCRLHSIL